MMRMPVAVGVAAAWLVTLPAGQSVGRTSLPSPVAAVESENAAEFVRQRNAEINASINRVAADRAAVELARRHNAEIEASIARVAARRAAEEFARQRNAEIDASIARVAARRAAEEFARQRNAEIDASIARVAARRADLAGAAKAQQQVRQ
jgi:hypothetical protein